MNGERGGSIPRQIDNDLILEGLLHEQKESSKGTVFVWKIILSFRAGRIHGAISRCAVSGWAFTGGFGRLILRIAILSRMCGADYATGCLVEVEGSHSFAMHCAKGGIRRLVSQTLTDS